MHRNDRPTGYEAPVDTPRASVPARLGADGARRGIGIVVGVLLLLTVIIPWGMHGSVPLWSWRLFTPAYASSIRLMLIGIWVVGGVVAFSGMASPGPARAVVYLCAGMAGTALYIVGNTSPVCNGYGRERR